MACENKRDMWAKGFAGRWAPPIDSPNALCRAIHLEKLGAKRRWIDDREDDWQTRRRPDGRTRERVPLDWALTQTNLGNALQTLGERESGTARLEEAVAAFRGALEERTRERVPLQWATTQNNLGNALWTLGGRESGTARLEEAVAAYRAALEERTRERVPLDCARTQNNLGIALRTLGEREGGTTRLEEALAAWDVCLTITTSVWPPEWVASVKTRRDETRAEIARRSAQ
jgi:tetratricopeptide (TPR) repeat protein